MSSLAQISIKFQADLKEFSSKIDNASREMQKFGKKMQSVGRGFSIGLTLPLVAFATKSAMAFDQQEKALAQVRQALISTGNTANKTLAELEKAAKSLQDNSLFGDEEILQGVTAQLLTFTNIASTQFDRTQQAALDLATRLGGDLKSASIQLGKALNDPVANLSALSRSGIQFSKEQKALINSLVSTNRLADAQTIILDELEKQYGGSAAAAAKAGLGGFKQLANQISDLTEEFGKIIVEGLNPVVERVKGVVSSLQGMSEGKKKLIVVIGAFLAAIGPVLIAISFLATSVIPGLITALTALKIAVASNPIGLLVTAVAALGAAVVLTNSRLTSLTDSQKEFAKVTENAARNIAKEKAELDKLLAIAKNEKVSKEDRIKAINELNRIVPEYNNQLTLETLNTKKADEATKQYIARLLQKAKVQAAQDKLVEVEKKLLDLYLGQTDAIKPSVWQQAANSLKSFGNGQLTIIRNSETSQKNLEAETNELENLKTKLTEFLTDNTDLLGGFQTDVQGVVNSLNNLTGAERPKVKAVLEIETTGAKGINETIAALEQQLRTFELARESYAATSEEYKNLSTAIDLVKNSIDEVKSGVTGTLVPDEFYNTDAIDAMNAKMEYLREVSEAVGEAVGDAFEGFANRFVDAMDFAADGFQGFMSNMIQTVIKLISALLAQSIAQSITAGSAAGLATGAAAPITTPAFIATMVSGVLSAFAAIPKFASGGIVSSPTLALVGEYAGASNNPEVIAPLSKLKDLLGDTGGSVFIPEARISGNDIVISYERTKARDNRLK